MTKNPFIKKLTAIRYRYGQKAADHFESNPFCEKCPEKRIAALNLHHSHGKKIEEFETLCFNCHMVHHANVAGEYTHQDYLDSLIRKASNISSKDAEIVKVWKEVNSLRIAGKILGISHNTVRNALIRQQLI